MGEPMDTMGPESSMHDVFVQEVARLSVFRRWIEGGRTWTQWIGYFYADDPHRPRGADVVEEPASPRYARALAAVPPGARIVSFSSAGRLDLDDGSAVIDGMLTAPGRVARHDELWRRVRRDDR